MLNGRPDLKDPSRRRLYGRRKGPALSARRKALVDQLLPRVELIIPPGDTAIDVDDLFEDPKDDLWIEIGFGMGEHLAAQAAGNPGIGFIGCEPYLNGIAGLLARIDEDGLSNIRIYADNALDVLEVLPSASVGRIFLLHPDPWHKKRHARRRFVSPGNLDIVARVLRDGGEFRLQTDDPGYVRWAMTHLWARRDFEWLAERAADWRQSPDDWPETRYETKAQISGRPSHYLCFRRTARAAVAAESRSMHERT